MNASYKASKAIIVYEKQPDVTDNAHGLPHHTVHIHEVREGKVCEGKPMTRETVMEICKIILPDLGKNVFLPDSVLAYVPGVSMVWWSPSCKRTVFFSNKCGIKSGVSPIPALLFVVHNGSFSVWALGSNNRPKMNTPVYHAPFYNVSENGSICTGSASKPSRVSVENIAKWEETFFKSRFTHGSGAPVAGLSLETLWVNLMSGKHRTFPKKHLVKAGSLDSIIFGGNHGN